MSEIISEQYEMLLISLCEGMALACGYNVIMIIRNVIKHNQIVKDIEDILYFMFVGIYIFVIVYIANQGIIRGFILFGVLAGASLFHMGIGIHLVKIVSKILNSIIDRLLKKTYKKVKIKITKRKDL